MTEQLSLDLETREQRRRIIAERLAAYDAFHHRRIPDGSDPYDCKEDR